MAWHCHSVRLSENPETQTFVVNYIVGFLFEYAQERGIGTDRVSNKREKLESTLCTCISTRHLQTVRIEVFDRNADDTAIEWSDLLIEWVSPDDLEKRQEADFNQYRKDVMKHLQDLDSLPSSVNYRVILGITSVNDLGQAPQSIDRWTKTTPRSLPESADVHDKDRQCDLTWYEHIV